MLLWMRIPVVSLDKNEKRTHSVEADARLPRARIRCPRCAWVPRSTDRWFCTCGHCWNTFDTRGVCPACNHQWKETACGACHEWSLHEDWYVR
jgi:hypothetical protein